jgi:hypothetical protein
LERRTPEGREKSPTSDRKRSETRARRERHPDPNAHGTTLPKARPDGGHDSLVGGRALRSRLELQDDGSGILRNPPARVEGSSPESTSIELACFRSRGAEKTQLPPRYREPAPTCCGAAQRCAGLRQGKDRHRGDDGVRRGWQRPLRWDCIAPGAVSGPFGAAKQCAPVALAAANTPAVRQLPERCACGLRQPLGARHHVHEK